MTLLSPSRVIKIIYKPGKIGLYKEKKVNITSFLSTGTQSLVQNLLAYPGLGHSGPLDLDGGGSGGGSSGGECPSNCTSSGGPQVSSLPPSLRVRLYELFVQIEREFEVLYAENISLQASTTCVIVKMGIVNLNGQVSPMFRNVRLIVKFILRRLQNFAKSSS